ncbi:hypothetical protein SFHH103_psfHH103d_634 (plasmid) [Sinorhizobium fredii HH103]|nr:hypothetical protein SFHH103_psfHH103d_634 [Sinorhizobium fredii HH103]
MKDTEYRHLTYQTVARASSRMLMFSSSDAAEA